jgi:PPK2 family polyphosphate:nucleotide phosphotransferase
MERYRVKPGQKVKLEDYDPADKSGWDGDKDSALERLQALKTELEALQGVLYAEGKHKLLVVLQAMDTAGKDGTIRVIFSGVNPQGVRVASFKGPTPAELAHDYLWRVHAQVPARGEIVIFNRSHYEDVLVVRVHSFVPPEVWSRRYRHIREFERMLAEEGVTILKFFLHIDLAEQKERLLERLNDPQKAWKFSSADLPERKLWPEYMKAYEAALEETSTEEAPWYAIPSNRNWYRELVISEILVKKLKSLDMKYPAPEADLAKYRQQLESE